MILTLILNVNRKALLTGRKALFSKGLVWLMRALGRRRELTLIINVNCPVGSLNGIKVNARVEVLPQPLLAKRVP